ncbi:MAG: SIMPL domain-containing protein [Spirochaetales bacterium]|nr:SIMPL domain-containing protein [Spirochaetales bacterium]
MKKTIRNLTFIAILAIVAFALASCSTLSGTSKEKATVSVSGTGIVYLKADIVTFSINVNETAQTTAEAQQKTNEKMTRIFEILKAFDIKDDNISTTALNFSSEYYWDNGKQIKTGEAVSQTVYVTMNDLDQFPKLADELGSKLSGISFYNVNFDSTKKEEAYSKARELAYQKALEKAELYAKSAGLEISRPISINEGYLSYGSANYKRNDMVFMEEAATAASYQTQVPSGLLSASIDVSVVFELK